MFHLFIHCRNHHIKLQSFDSPEAAKKQGQFHSLNCGDSLLFEIYHKTKVITSFVNGLEFSGEIEIIDLK